MVCAISARVFITKGPCCSTGSPIGRPCSSRNSAASSPFTRFTATPARNSMALAEFTAWPPTVTDLPLKKYRLRRVPAAMGAGTRRSLYFFKGKSVTVGGQAVNSASAIELRAGAAVNLVNGDEVAEFLLLQGRPIGEPVEQHGPFVMNTRAEIAQTIEDYRRTQFGGWPWPDSAPVHGRDPARFARHPDGREERPAC